MNTSIIDTTFSGLSCPLHVIPVGRPEVTDRPGDALMELVSGFAKDGGFRDLAENRKRQLVYDETPAARPQVTYAPVSRNVSRWLEGDLDAFPNGNNLD